MAYGDAKTMQALFGGPRPKKVRKPAVKFTVGEKVIYCGKPATIVSKEGRVFQIDCGDGRTWPSNGKDLKKIA